MHFDEMKKTYSRVFLWSILEMPDTHDVHLPDTTLTREKPSNLAVIVLIVRRDE